MNNEKERTMDFFEVTHTQRAMRRLHPDPVSDDDIWTILETATMAPNGGNRQPWNFIVIRDPEKKRKLGEWYLEAWNRTYGPAREQMRADPNMVRTFNSADYLANHLADCPVLILATIQKEMMAIGPTLGASIYPAVQNLMLAAGALGLGTTLTTLHKLHEAEVKTLLGIPDNVETMALIPIGRPKGKFGTPSRLPVDKVVYWDAWNTRRDRR
jgi:nitroreductase